MILNLLNPALSGVIDAAMSDEDIISKYMETQRTAYFDLLYDRYSDKVYAKCIGMLKDDMQAEDAVQDIFMKVLLSLAKFKHNSRFSTWLYSITYNFCIDVIRRKKKDRKYITEVEDMGNLEGVSEEDDESDILEASIKQMKQILEMLKPSDRAVLLMKYQDELSIRDITVILEQSESAVKMKIKRAKERFRKEHRKLEAIAQ